MSSPKFNKDFKLKNYNGKELPNYYSPRKYKDDIILLKNTTESVVYVDTLNSDNIDLYCKIQCNNMIPVPNSELIKIDINEEPDAAYRMLLIKEINYIRSHGDTVVKKHIDPVYNNRIHNRMQIGYIRLATPDFKLLEGKCDLWEQGKRN